LEGTYRISAWLNPGDTIKVYATEANGAPSATPRHRYPDDGTTITGALNYDCQVSLPGGVCGVRITNAYGMAGTLEKVKFGQPIYTTWTYANVPIAKFGPLTLLGYLPIRHNPPGGSNTPPYTEGSTYNMDLACPRCPDPIDLGEFSGYVDDGTVAFSNPPHSDLAASALPSGSTGATTIHIYGPPTPEDEDRIRGTDTLHLDFTEYQPRHFFPDTSYVNSGGAIRFYLKRTADYHERHVPRVIYHLGL
jgi:hypothetical protein